MAQELDIGAAPGQVADEKVQHEFIFSGSAGEYFGIWISNLFLSVVTLGIYSAWAKVRRLRYFYGNTSLDNHAFDYHGNPVAILKGRLLAVGVLLLFNVFANLAPMFALVLYPLLVLAFPWVIVRSLRFNARMTSYRNVRFDFVGTYGGAFMALIIWPIVGVISFGLLLPAAMKAGREFTANHFSFGGRPFAAKLSTGKLYVYSLQTLGLVIAISFLLSLFMSLFASVSLSPEGENADVIAQNMVMALLPVYFALIVIVPAYFSTKVTNHVYSNLILDNVHGFTSTLSPWTMIWIAASNIAAVVLTLGFLYPWAQIRLARYRAENTTLLAGGDLDAYASEVQEDSPVGDALGDMLDMDVAF